MSNPVIALRFDEIYNSTSKPVLAFIISKCGKTMDIHDIFQDTYMELYQVLKRRGADYITNEKALVFKIAKRKIAKYYSFMERFKHFSSLNGDMEGGDVTDLSDFDAHSFLMEDFLVNRVLLEDVKQFILSKPENTKKVFYLFYELGYTIPEIAQLLSLSESNVKNILYRTLKELRILLEK